MEERGLEVGSSLLSKEKQRKHNQRALEDVATWKRGKRLKCEQTISTIHKHYNVESTKTKIEKRKHDKCQGEEAVQLRSRPKRVCFRRGQKD